MKNPKIVFQELGDLYEFYRQIKKFKIKENKNVQQNGPANFEYSRGSHSK